ncbi:MAG: ATP-binding protein, partial [Cytophagia bacterium]
MLIQFSVKNYKTFAEEAKLSMVASKDNKLEDTNIFDSGFGYKLLKTAVIYGANASGKTKFIEAMNFMWDMIENSNTYQSNRKINVEPFRLNTKNETSPSLFEVIFIDDNEMYRYGFEVTKEKIIAEWLFMRQNNGKPKEIELFYRQEQDFQYHKTKFKIKDLIDNKRIKSNSLLLSVADNANEKTAQKVFHWITNHWLITAGLKTENYFPYTANQLDNNDFKNKIINFLKNADLGIQDINPKFTRLEDLPKKLQELIKDEDIEDRFISDVFTSRKKFNELNQLVGQEIFLMNDDESSGTKKYFILSGLILDSLENGNVFVIDELDAALHTNLVHQIIQLFHSNITNPKNAQLIFNTH